MWLLVFGYCLVHGIIDFFVSYFLFGWYFWLVLLVGTIGWYFGWCYGLLVSSIGWYYWLVLLVGTST